MCKVRFHTVGMPRSRSLWLSFLLRHDISMCYHEILGSGGEIPEDLLVAGSCETDPRLDFKGERVVLVYRDVEETAESLSKQFNVSKEDALKACKKLKTALDEQPRDNALVVNYEDLSDVDKVEDLCEFLLPGLISRDYIEYMINCNIQTMNDDIYKGIRKEDIESLCS